MSTRRFPVREPRPGFAVVDLSGDLRSDARQALQAAYAEAAATGPHTVVLGMTGVGYVNSTGIALLVDLLARARRDGRAVAAFGLTEHYREVFAITRLSEFISVYADEPSALGHVPTGA
ncbi:STAS domain-containing protein [Geodermatophilus sp. SYSU D00766]